MGIFERLGDVFRSYLNDNDEDTFNNTSRSRQGDPDVDAAFEELEEFLGRRRETGGSKTGPFGAGNGFGRDTSWNKQYQSSTGNQGQSSRQTPQVPESLRKDFSELGLPFGASAEECKATYKKLLMVHHPDRHAGHEQNMRKATEKSARINAAFDRIERWRTTGRTD